MLHYYVSRYLTFQMFGSGVHKGEVKYLEDLAGEPFIAVSAAQPSHARIFLLSLIPTPAFPVLF